MKCFRLASARVFLEKVVTVSLTSTAWYKQQSGEHDGIFTLRQPPLTNAVRVSKWVSELERERHRGERRGGGKKARGWEQLRIGRGLRWDHESCWNKRGRERKDRRDWADKQLVSYNTLVQWFPNLSWRTPCPAHFLCLPNQTHPI